MLRAHLALYSLGCIAHRLFSILIIRGGVAMVMEVAMAMRPPPLTVSGGTQAPILQGRPLSPG